MALSDELSKLAELRSSGSLTEEEFNRADELRESEDSFLAPLSTLSV